MAPNESASVEELLAQARTAFESGDFTRSTQLAQEVCSRAPRDPRGWAMRGYALKAAGRVSDATAALQESVAIDDQDLEVALTLAHLYQQQGRTDEALSLANFVLLEEEDQPELRRRAQSLKDTIQGVGGLP